MVANTHALALRDAMASAAMLLIWLSQKMQASVSAGWTQLRQNLVNKSWWIKWKHFPRNWPFVAYSLYLTWNTVHSQYFVVSHNDVIKWEHFPCYWPCVQGIHQSPVNSLHKGQWRGALMFSLICAWTNGCANNSEAGDLRCHPTHYDITVMCREMIFCQSIWIMNEHWNINLMYLFMEIKW